MFLNRHILLQLFQHFKLLDRGSRLLFLKTFIWILGCKVGLRITNYNFISKVLFGKSRDAKPQGTNEEIDRTITNIISFVSLIGNGLFEGNCLCNAMVVKLMLARRNFPVNIRIGISCKGGHHLRGHAWVEKDGKILMGGNNSVLLYIPIHEDSLLFKKICSSVS
jgi:hypothetical protein